MTDVVTIRVANVNANKAAIYAAGVIKSYNEYTGKIVPNPKWVGNDCICISTGDLQWPFRIIDRDRIVDQRTGQLPIADKGKPRSETFIVKGSKPGSSYTVTRSDSSWSCSCVGFGFRKDCKHVRERKG